MTRWTVAIFAVALSASAASANPERELNGGFRMEGDPKIETVFGDAAQFKRYIDRFFVVHTAMQTAREDFSRNVQAVLASLAAHQAAGGKKCPVDAVALSYARAYRFGQQFHQLGKELEANYISLRELDSLGETSGLTPDYRWKVARGLRSYPDVLKDFREMRASFQDQLAAEVRFRGCDPQALIAKGEELEKTGAAPTGPVASSTPLARKDPTQKNPLPTPVQATTATFFIDNGSCKTPMRVYLDSTLVGDVASSSKAAFRALVGRHDLCLIPTTSAQNCGEPGTVRNTYIHDGWSIALRCD
jgi:hypothetical protein